MEGAIRSENATGVAINEDLHSPKHIPSLDGFRGMAALAVVVFHYLPHAGLRLFSPLISSGWTGVDAFLVLSGFLITGILYRQRETPRFFRNFYIRRALRLFPLYYFILLLALFTSLFGGQHWRLGHLGLLLYATNIVLACDQSLGDLGTFNMRHCWTLALEEQFYFVWPWIVGSRLSRRALLRFCIAGVAFAVVLRFVLFFAGANRWWLAYSLFTRMDSLLIGAAIALIPLPQKRHAHWLLIGSVAIYAILVAIGRTLFFTSPPILLLGYTVLAFFYASILVLALHPETHVARFLSISPLRFLGRLSYGIYLWHYLLSAKEEALHKKISLAMHPQALASLSVFGIAFGLSVAIAFLSYRIIERPFLRLKEWFEGTRC